MTYEDDKKEKIRVRTIKRSFVILTILFLLVLVAFSWVLKDVQDLANRTAKLTKVTAHLTLENTKRILEIQNSRVQSCKQTYSGVRKVVYKLLPKPSKRTATQKKNLAKFNQTIQDLRNGCVKQTRPKNGGS